MTEGHHYNRPRRFSRDFYPRPPYAVHEDLWRRQYQEQEARRRYWTSPSFNENTQPEVQLLPPPSLSNNYLNGDLNPAQLRFVASFSDTNNNSNDATPSTEA